jgi:prevent-host-death family protein
MNTGHMKTMNASQFKAECLRLLDVVGQTGEPIVILKRGRPVARVVSASVAGDKPWLALADSGRFVGDPFAPVLDEHEVEALT